MSPFHFTFLVDLFCRMISKIVEACLVMRCTVRKKGVRVSMGLKSTWLTIV